MHDDIDHLVTQVRRSSPTPREQRLLLAIERLRVEHKFAFESWQAAVKRSGVLSAELAQATTVELRAEDAKTVVNAGARVPPRFDPEEAKTRFYKHSGGALVVKTGRSR